MSKPKINVLLVEDVEDDMIIIEDHLSLAEYEQFTVTWVSEKAEALEEIDKDSYDVVLLDHDLVGFTGMEVLSEARRRDCHKAIIFLSGSKNPEIRSQALAGGASGFLIKGDISPAMLELSILFSIEKARNLNSLEIIIDERTAELQKTIGAMETVMRELRDTQNQLVERETMANLGNLAAGIAHEINTPVGVGVTAASYLQDKTSEMVQRLRHNAVDDVSLNEYLTTAHTASEMILKNLSRAAELIHGFKRMAVDQQAYQQRVFQIYECINDVILSMKVNFKNSNHEVEVECDRKINLNSYPGIYSQIITNLISNSYLHGFTNVDAGRISISIDMKSDALVIKYSDNGGGLDDAALRKLFIPFNTTKRNQGGSGIGTTIIMNCVNALGGKIKVDSKLGQGLSYVFTFPHVNGKQSLSQSSPQVVTQ